MQRSLEVYTADFGLRVSRRHSARSLSCVLCAGSSVVVVIMVGDGYGGSGGVVFCGDVHDGFFGV